ncbi:MAG: aromatic hydrocarbon degradation protein [Gammaproteobacteria bacterium]|jgi:long-chain fatty acid transport protein|nr:aromatic hydrocarbon degradation protein [Gammaproteobacteria bacterium]
MRKFNFNYGSFILAALISLGSAGSAHAAGFALIEMNANGQGNAYAGAAAYTPNASTVYFNPAGMMQLEGEQISIASHYIDPTSDFENKGSTLADGITPIGGSEDDGGESAFVPNFYWVRPLDDNMSFGLGVNSPFGLKTEYEDDWVGRYHAILSDLKTVNFNPSIGYRASDKVSIGGGINVMLADVELSSAVDYGSICAFFGGAAAVACGTPGSSLTDGLGELEADNYDDVGLGFNIGLTYMVSDVTTIGVAYRSQVDIDVDGDADFSYAANPAVEPIVTGAGLFTDTGLRAKVTLPAKLSVSIAHRIDKFTWLADATWTGWSSFDELRIEYDNPNQPDTVTTEDWDDSWRYSVGFDYQATDALVLRAGLALDETPIPSSERRTPRIPGDDRTWVSLGLTYVASDAFSFDVGYSHLFIDDVDIDNTLENAVPSTNATLTGEYEAEVDILSAQLNWKID